MQGHAVAILELGQLRRRERHRGHPGIGRGVVEGGEDLAVAIAEGRDGRGLQVGEGVNQMIAVGRDDRAMRARLGGHAGDRAAVEGDAIDVGLQRPLATGREPDLAAFRVHADHGIDGPVARGQGADELAVAVAEFQVPEACPLGGPEQLARRRDDLQVVVQVHESVRPLLDDRRLLAGRDVDPDEAQRLLVAGQNLDEQRQGAVPIDPGEVEILAGLEAIQQDLVAPPGLTETTPRRTAAFSAPAKG